MLYTPPYLYPWYTISTMEAPLLEHTLTTFEACEFLSLSERTISRYIKAGLLRPKLIKNPHGIPSYRFSTAELEDIRARQARRQGTGHTPLMAALEVAVVKEISETPQTPPIVVGQDRELIDILKGQLVVKDEQIKSLLDQTHEANVLLLKNQEIIKELQAPIPQEPPTQWGNQNV